MYNNGKCNSVQFGSVGYIKKIYKDKYQVDLTSLFTRKRKSGFILRNELFWGNLDSHIGSGEKYLATGDIVYISNDLLINKIGNVSSNDTSILITNRCNQDCIMCAQGGNDDNKNDSVTNEICSIVAEIYLKKKVPIIGISGGEPSLCLNQINQLLAKCSKGKFSPAIEILSNSALFENEDSVKNLEKIKNMSFHIPLYSDSERIHNAIVRRKHFYKTIKGIYNLAKYRYAIEIRNVIMKCNYERLPNWAEFISHNFPFVCHVAIMGLEPMGNALSNIKKIWIEPAETINELSSAIQILNRAQINVSVYNYPLCLLPPKLRDYYAPSISDWKRLYINECHKCQKKNICCGIFISQEKYHSKFIKPIIGEYIEDL